VAVIGIGYYLCAERALFGLGKSKPTKEDYQNVYNEIASKKILIMMMEATVLFWFGLLGMLVVPTMQKQVQAVVMVLP
jgi:hypothetical protein